MTTIVKLQHQFRIYILFLKNTENFWDIHIRKHFFFQSKLGSFRDVYPNFCFTKIHLQKKFCGFLKFILLYKGALRNSLIILAHQHMIINILKISNNIYSKQALVIVIFIWTNVTFFYKYSIIDREYLGYSNLLTKTKS